MAVINARKLRLKILNSLDVKSNRELKNKLVKFNSLKNFITICAPFIFSNKFIKLRNNKIWLIVKIIQIKNKTIETIETIIFIFRCLLNQIFVDKMNVEKNFFFFSNRITDQYNIYPLSNYLLKNDINHTLLFDGNSEVLKKIEGKFKKRIYQLKNFFIISDFLKGYFNFINKKKEIIKLCKILNFKGEKKKEIYNFFISFFMHKELFKRIFKNQQIDIVLANKFNSPALCSLIYYLKYKKNNKNFLSIAYALIGVGGESGLYVHSNTDIVLTTSRDDSQILGEIKKKKLSILPMPNEKIIGSVRNEIVKRQFYKKSSKKINLLFIKSNSVHYDNIDDLALKIFVKSVKKFDKEINFQIKDRYKKKSGIVKQMLRDNLITKKNIVDDKEIFIEKSIINSDICVGTCSSALTKQAFWMKKPIIQLFREKLYSDQFKNAMVANNEKELDLILKNLLKKKYLKKRIVEAKKTYKKLYLTNQDPVKNFYKYLSNVL